MEPSDDQDYFPQNCRAGSSSNVPPQPKGPPPLPPRPADSSTSSLLDPPHGKLNGSYHTQPIDQLWLTQDPRSSSTQSLVPTEKPKGKRTLLLIYIHGFLGNETSFRSFPAHVHNLVSFNLAKTHIVHTKIYPRYKSRRAIEHARDEFSDWLLPNESADTDVILLGHSMGGILSAEVTFLLSSPSFTTGTQKFRHQILGTINFDCPFLGMHPGVVVSGIGSLFRSAPTSPGAQNLNAYSEDQLSELNPSNGRRASSPSLNPLSLSHSNQEPGSSSGASYMVDVSCPPGAFEASGTQGATEIRPYTRLSPSDPNYNPPFPNDVRLPERTGWVNALHFLNKHSHDLTKAASAYVTSHLDFGGCLADYKGLKNRYTKLRALENTKTVPDNSRRIRFLNYYTACTGRPKNTKLMAGGGPYTRAAKIPSAAQLVTNQHLQDLQGIQNLSLSATSTRSPIPSPRISIEEHRDGEVHPKALEDPEVLQSMREENPPSDGRTVDLKDGLTEHPADQSTSQHRLSNESESLASTLAKPDDSHSLPPPPPFPVWPLSYDPAAYPDKTTRNLAHKKYTTEFKSHMQALKAYDKSINQRLKLLDKQDDRDDRAKKSTKTKKPPAPSQLVKASPPKNKEPAPASSSSLLSIKPAEKEDSSHEYDDNDGSSVGGGGGGAETKPPPKRDRRFCVVPSRINGQMDPCWVRVFMNGVDEVGAHCGLFVPGEHYGWLVDDVGGRIQGWVEEM